MDPTKLNLLITSFTNHLYENLTPQEFFCLNIVVSELSKSMFAMNILREVCDKMEPEKEKKE